MKVIQTLGFHAGQQAGIFQYRRTFEGVQIDASVGQAHLNPSIILIRSDEWNSILKELTTTCAIFRLTPNRAHQQPPYQSLYDAFSTAVPQPSEGWAWNDSWKSYVCAILANEGSVEIYHGPLGPNAYASINVRADLSLN
jgi:hypothetical protein